MDTQKRINWFQTIAQLLLLALIVLLPIFFMPAGNVSFQFSKVLLLTITVGVAVLLVLIDALRRGRIKVPAHRLALIPLGVPLIFVISALAATPQWVSLVGYGFEVSTAGFTVLMFLLLYLVITLFQSYNKVFYPYILFFVSFLILAVFHGMRFIAGPENIIPGFFPGPLANTIGNWNGLAFFFSLGAVLSAITLDMLPAISIRVKGTLYTIYALSLVFITIIHFPLLLTVFTVVMLLFGAYNYFGGIRKFFSFSMIAGLISLALIIPVIPSEGGFSPLGQYIGNVASEQFSIANIEVRPSLDATLGIARDTLGSGNVKDLVLGSGPNTFGHQWNVHKPADVNASRFWNSSFQYGSGLIPTFFVTTGVLGILALLAFFGFLIYAGIKSFQASFEAPLARYMTLSAFLMTVYFWAFLCLYTASAALTGLAFVFTGLFIASVYRYNIFPSHTLHLFENKKKAPLYIGIIILLFAAVLFIGIKNMKSVLASTYFQRSSQVVNAEGDIERSQRLLVRALNLSENDIYYRAFSELQLVKLNRLLRQQSDLEQLAQSELQGSLDVALIAARRAVEIYPNNYLNHIALAKIYTQILPVDGAVDGARQAFLGAHDAHPTNPTIFLDLARIEFSQGDTEAARAYIDEAFKIKSNYTAAAFLAAQIDIETGNTEAAIGQLEQAVAVSPNDPLVYFQLGLLKYTEENFVGAREAFERALLLNNSYANARYFLGLTYYRLGGAEAARLEFELLAELFPENEGVASILADLNAGVSPFENSVESPEEQEELPIEETIADDSASIDEDATAADTSDEVQE